MFWYSEAMGVISPAHVIILSLTLLFIVISAHFGFHLFIGGDL